MYRVVVTQLGKNGQNTGRGEDEEFRGKKNIYAAGPDAPTRNDARLTSLQRRAEWTRPQRTAPFATVRVKEEKGCRADATWKCPSSTWYQAAIRGLGLFKGSEHTNPHVRYDRGMSIPKCSIGREYLPTYICSCIWPFFIYKYSKGFLDTDPHQVWLDV